MITFIKVTIMIIAAFILGGLTYKPVGDWLLEQLPDNMVPIAFANVIGIWLLLGLIVIYMIILYLILFIWI